MKNYLELMVPVRQDSEWLEKLRNAFAEKEIPVKWQGGGYHITVAFMKDVRHFEELQMAFDEILSNSAAPQLTLNRVGVFKTMKGNELIVYLTSSAPDERFTTLVNNLRTEAERIGANMEPGFFLHITLGRIDAQKASIEQVKEIISSIVVPPFTLILKEAEYRLFRSSSIQEWKMTHLQ